MPILTKEVEVKISNRNAKYYESLGYEIPMKKASEITSKNYKKEYVYDVGKSIVVNVDDLSKGSHIEIDCLCDYCLEEIVSMPYCSYIDKIKEINKIACQNCYQQKTKEISILHYGVDSYMKTKEFREKYTNAMFYKYGVEHNSQLPDYKEKFHNTCIEKYGDTYRQQFAEKSFNTFRKRTGYDNPSQSPEIKEKTKQSCLNKFGYEYSLQSPEVRERISQTLYANSSQKTSKQQRYINNVYNGVLNFPIKYYNADIFLPDSNLIIEYDGGGHMINVITGRETIEEYTRKEIIRNKVIKSEGYKQMKIISSKDLLPSDKILLQMLNDAKQYFNTTSHTWINFDIDNSKMINAENKNDGGIYYDYDALHFISSIKEVV